MPKIEKLFAFVCADSGPDDEGVIGQSIGGLMMPFVGADQKRITSLLPLAKDIAKATGKQFRILEFSVRKDVTGDYT